MSDTDPGQIAKGILDGYNNKLSAVVPKAVGSQILLMSGIGLATVLAFNILRPRNKIIYEPKTKYYVGDKRPPKISSGFFSWVHPLITTKEDALLPLVGLDAVAYLRFLRMLRWLFTIIAALTCAVLIPVNVVFNLRSTSSTNTLAMLTIGNVNGNILYVHVGVTYAITFLILGYVHFHWKKMVALRTAFFRSPEYTASFYARTLMILKVPRPLQSDAGLQSLFASIQAPYPTTDVHIGRRVGELPELIAYHNDTVRQLEQVLVGYLKGGRIGKARPTVRIGGFMGLGGDRVDAIDYYTQKVRKLDAAVEEWRAKIDLKRAESYGFASMAAVPYAHIVAKMMRGKSPKGASIGLAPNPKDIIWKNLTLSDGDRARLSITGFLILVLVCFFNTVPLLAISAVSNLAAISQWVPFLDTWSQDSNWTFSLASGILPPAISGAFGYFLPLIMRRLSKYQGSITRSRADRTTVARYYAFLVISQFLIFSLLGVAFQTVSLIITDVNSHKGAIQILQELYAELPTAVQTTYVSQSNYWLTWYPLRGYLAVFDLAQLINLVWVSMRTRLFGRTPRDIRDWTQPPSFDYAIYYPSLLFMATVALLYAPLAPLVALMAACVFWISSFIYKYQLMFVFVTKVESGGRLWNVVINRLLAGTIFMHLLMALTMWLGAGAYAAISIAPLVLIVLGFKIYLNQAFYQRFMWYVPDEAELALNKVHSSQADVAKGRLEKRFGHPALQAELFTPMVHANMAQLLPEVYHGRLAYGTTNMAEYGGQKLEAQVAGGIMIAAVEQRDLAMDPQLYGRDRGEENWDARSIASTAVLNNDEQSPRSPLEQGKQGYYSQPPAKPVGYDDYMQHGPHLPYGPAASMASLATTQEEIELSRIESHHDDNRPLLVRQQTTESVGSLPETVQGYPVRGDSPQQYRSPSPPRRDLPGAVSRDVAPAERFPRGVEGGLPATPRPGQTRRGTADSDGRNTNMAGRGAFNSNQSRYGQGPPY